MITHASTFSGIGAPEVAAEMLGWENVFHCEINPFGRRVLDYYFPKAKSYEDITRTDFSEWRDRITVLTGGFPCQPFSYAGRRRGSEDDRYLWPFMLRCIEQVRPSWFVGENVAGITTMAFPGEDVKVGEQTDLFGACDEVYEKHERYVLDEICQSLERAGYSVQPMLIPACAVGAPHRRDRVFIVAHRVAESVAYTNGCDNGTGRPEEPTSTMREERLSERDAIQQSIITDGLRSRVERHTSYATSQRRREIYEQADVANSERKGFQARLDERSDCEQNRQSSSGSGRGNCEDGSGARTDADTDCEGRNRMCASSTERKKENGGQRLSAIQCESKGLLLPENRWRTFPSVSPVYRGNDGLPFPVDHITIPFSEWKRESLKAYGNAIVPQVMYEIFRCIDEIEKTLKPK